jgi:predicted aspartyl protease
MVVTMLVDTGADGSVLPRGIVEKLGLVPAGDIRVAGVSGALVVVSAYRCVIVVDGQPIEARVVAVGEEAILGRDVLEHLVVELDGPRRRVRASGSASTGGPRSR